MSSDENVGPLIQAAKDGSLEEVQRYLSLGVYVNCQDKDGRTPLYVASEAGHTEVVELLLKYNADPNSTDGPWDSTPLYKASEAGHTEIVKILLNCNADPNICDKFYACTPLHKASQYGRTEVVKLLLKYNADPNISDERGQTPLHVAGNEVIAECLINHGADINTLDKEAGRTPLYKASEEGRTEVVQLLLKYYADPNISDEGGCTPLFQACRHTEVVELLLKYNADPNIGENKYGWTPLCIASISGHTEVVKLLLKYNADPNISDVNDMTPLHVVDNEVIAECLINNGADINTLDNDGHTPLYKASNAGNTEMVKLLLKYNADSNISDEGLNSPLHVACDESCIDIVQCLVENGASVKARNKHNQTPIDILKQSHEDPSTAERRNECLEWLNQMGYLEDASAVPIADLSTEVSSSSPSIDKMDSYGLSLDVDPSSLSSQGSPILADIKVFTVDDDEMSTPSFTFPEETKPVSAVYTISLSDTHVPLRTLKIRHCADPNNPEELEQLMFVKSSDDSSSKFEVVPGGTFKPGEQYGEITPPHMCSWTIVRSIKKFFVEKARYVGTILYQTVKQHPDVWIVQLLVAKHDPTSNIALNEYINNKCGLDVVKEPEFLFTFEDSDKLQLGLAKAGKDERVLKCNNGWEISLDMYEISQDTVDHFKRPTDVPGRCSLKIHTHMNPCHELALLPTVTLNGIISDKKHIQINPPDGAEFPQRDYTNVRPQLKDKGEVPTLEAVFELMKRYSARWNEFGRALRIDHNDRQILYDERISAEARLEKVIYKWIESECSPVTWDYLIDVLRRMGLQDVIDAIETESQPPIPGPIPKPPELIPKPHEPIPKPHEPIPKPLEPIPGDDPSSSSYLTGPVMISALVVLLAIGAAASIVLLRRYKK